MNDPLCANNNNCELKFPFEIRDVDASVCKELLKDFTGWSENHFGMRFLRFYEASVSAPMDLL